MIKRDIYLQKLIQYRDQHIIKVVTGIRRCGKSSLLQMFETYLKENGVEDRQILSINFEDMDFSHLTTAKVTYDSIVSQLHPSKVTYIFLDEVQNVENFQKAVDSLFIKRNVDLYITGSNAMLLSGELATLLSGRYIEIAMLPLSFKEYIDYLGDRMDLNRKYLDYLRFSSFPFAVKLNKNSEMVRDYLDGLYKTVVLKDVLSRNRIADPMMLESVIRFIFDNIGNQLSTHKISTTMTDAGRKISTHTVESYLAALVDSFIIYRSKRYDIKGKQYLRTNDKFYVCDIGLRTYLLGTSNMDQGHVLENIVYLELIRRGYDVFVGKMGEKEVDFVGRKGDEIQYFQVSKTIMEPKTLLRELNPLQAITDHYPKTLLTFDEVVPSFENGIRIMNVLDFLLE